MKWPTPMLYEISKNFCECCLCRDKFSLYIWHHVIKILNFILTVITIQIHTFLKYKVKAWQYKPYGPLLKYIHIYIYTHTHMALAGMAHWIKHQPANQSVAGSIPSQGTPLGCRLGPQVGECERPSTLMFLSLFLKK